MQNITKVWTDGACFPNPGKGGWAWTTLNGEYDSGHEAHTTNNIMELRGPIEAIKALYSFDRPLLILSDSQYVVKGITEWVEGWEKNNWLKKGSKEIKNLEVWMELYELTRGTSIFFQWVRGHSGNAGNEEADRLATLASGVDKHVIQKCSRIWKKKGFRMETRR